MAIERYKRDDEALEGEVVVGSTAREKPKKAGTWAAILSEVGELYADELATMLGQENPYFPVLIEMPKGVRMKYLVAATVFAHLLVHPDKGLLDAIIDRTDGKVPVGVKMDRSGEVIIERRVGVETDKL